LGVDDLDQTALPDDSGNVINGDLGAFFRVVQASVAVFFEE
jgi:hypothetical protein